MVRAPSKWNKHLMSVYRQMKSKNKNIKLSDAMKEARKSYDYTGKLMR